MPELADLELTSAQLRVVNANARHGHMLVVAPPGSGKTLTITHRIDYLLAEGIAEPSQILALTFTRRAAGELVERLIDSRREGVFAGTFHAFCANWLTERGAGTGVPMPLRILDERARQDLIERLLCGFGFQPDLKAVQSFGRWISDQKCGRSNAYRRYVFDETFGEQAFAEYRDELRSRGSLDFDDLILETNRILAETTEEAERLHSLYRFVCVDEFHDVSPEQYQLLTRLVPTRLPDRQLLAVVDSNQSIYGFRGADAIELLAQFKSDYGPLGYQLEENFRSTSQIVSASKRVIQGAGVVDQSVSQRDGEYPAYCCGYADAHEEADALAEMVARAIGAGHNPETIAILYRRHLRGNAIEQALIARNIPLTRIAPERFFDSPMAQEALRYLELMQASHERGFQAAMNWPRRLIDELSMAHLQQIAVSQELTLVELAFRPDLLTANCSPLTVHSIRSLMSNVILPLLPIADGTALEAGEQLLARLREHRSAVQAECWPDYAATLRRTDLSIGDQPPLRREDVQGCERLSIHHDGSPDCILGSLVFAYLFESYLNCAVDLQAGDVEGLRIEIPGVSPIALNSNAERNTSPVSLQAFRLCQRLLSDWESLLGGRFVVLDIETTGLNWKSNEILQIGAWVLEDGKLTGERFCEFVRPASEDSITPATHDAHDINWKHVKDARLTAVVIAEFLAFIGNDTLVGHNIVAFDLPVLQRVANAAGLEWPASPVIDTCLIARRLHPGESAALDDLLTPEELAERKTHDACLDARLTGQLFIRLSLEVKEEREAGSLSELLPLVAASLFLLGKHEDLDFETVATAGAGCWRQGHGRELVTDALRRLAPDLHTTLLGWLESCGKEYDEKDRQWRSFEAGWLDALAEFSRQAPDAGLAAFLNYVHLAQPLDLELDDVERVTMMTIHAAKGLEWEIVFIAGVEQNEFVFSSNPDEIEEGRRVLYVGMTRARERLVLTWVKRFNNDGHRLCEFVLDNLSAFVPVGVTKELAQRR